MANDSTSDIVTIIAMDASSQPPVTASISEFSLQSTLDPNATVGAPFNLRFDRNALSLEGTTPSGATGRHRPLTQALDELRARNR